MPEYYYSSSADARVMWPRRWAGDLASWLTEFHMQIRAPENGHKQLRRVRAAHCRRERSNYLGYGTSEAQKMVPGAKSVVFYWGFIFLCFEGLSAIVTSIYIYIYSTNAVILFFYVSAVWAPPNLLSPPSSNWAVALADWERGSEWFFLLVVRFGGLRCRGGLCGE